MPARSTRRHRAAQSEPDALVDTSVAIALAVHDHEAHAATVAALRDRVLGLSGHAWFEAFSVLTRLPPGKRQSPANAARILGTNFPASRFLDREASAKLTVELAQLGVAGGSVYDALVGAAARDHGLVLLTRDGRAKRTYDAMGASVELLGG